MFKEHLLFELLLNMNIDESRDPVKDVDHGRQGVKFDPTELVYFEIM